MSKIYKQLIQLNTRKTNKPVKKQGKDLKRTLPEENVQMANKHMKSCSTLLITREMKIKTTMIYHITPVRMFLNKMSTNNICCRGCGEKGNILHCWWECKLIQPLWKMVCRFLKKLGIKSLCDTEILLQGKYPEEIKIEKYTCIPFFMASLSTIARIGK